VKLLKFIAPDRKSISDAWTSLIVSLVFLVGGILLGVSPFLLGAFATFAYRDVLDVLVAYVNRSKVQNVKVTGEVL
jgi:hypothetical protein